LGKRVLVHCEGGLGRSPSFVAAYLVFKGHSAKEAVDLLKKKRGAFNGADSIHIPIIKRFQTGLADKMLQIAKLAESNDPCK
jgi:protein-tyrosine phosphatase